MIRLDLLQPVVSVVPADAAGYWREDRVRRGDTIGSVLARLGVDDPAALEFLRTNPSARPLYQLRPGKPLTVETDDDGRLVNLRFVTGDGLRLSIARAGDRLTAESAAAPVEIRWKMAIGEIRSSLFAAADAAGLPDAVTLQMAEVFAGDIDFYHDLRRGDRFTVVYETSTSTANRSVPGHRGRRIREPRPDVSRVSLARRGRRRELLHGRRRADAEVVPALADGVLPRGLRLLECALPPDPADVARAQGRRTTPLPPARRCAPPATPGSPFAGTQNGYGNVIELQHTARSPRVYAHLSRFAPQVPQGARVTQGEVIGFVGQTGWATGPHLHYEFRAGGEQRNPLTVALPSGEPLRPSIGRRSPSGWRRAAEQLVLARTFSGAQLASDE